MFESSSVDDEKTRKAKTYKKLVEEMITTEENYVNDLKMLYEVILILTNQSHFLSRDFPKKKLILTPISLGFFGPTQSKKRNRDTTTVQSIVFQHY